MENKDSFGQDSLFAYLKEVKAKNIFIDVSYQNSLLCALCRRMEGKVPYRYVKDFTAGYIDEQGIEETRTYSMFVRDADMDVYVTMIDEEFLWQIMQFKNILSTKWKFRFWNWIQHIN